MVPRVFAIVVLVVALENGVIGQENKVSPKVGDQVILNMTGELAKEYGKRTRVTREGAPFSNVETPGTIEKVLEDGRIRIEHSTPVYTESNLTGMVTLTVTVESAKLATRTVPNGTQIYASPAAYTKAALPVLSRQDATMRTLHLSELKGLKLRSWTLSEEIGE